MGAAAAAPYLVPTAVVAPVLVEVLVHHLHVRHAASVHAVRQQFANCDATVPALTALELVDNRPRPIAHRVTVEVPREEVPDEMSADVSHQLLEFFVLSHSTLDAAILAGAKAAGRSRRPRPMVNLGWVVRKRDSPLPIGVATPVRVMKMRAPAHERDERMIAITRQLHLLAELLYDHYCCHSYIYDHLDDHYYYAYYSSLKAFSSCRLTSDQKTGIPTR